MRCIYSSGRRHAGAHDDETATITGSLDLARYYGYPESHGRAYVRACMVSTIDGAAWGPDHRSASISSPPDRVLFATLRGLADVIVVGAGTARAEAYGPAVTETELGPLRAAAGQRPDPTIAVVSRSLAFDPGSPLFSDAVEPTIVITTEDSPRRRRDVLAEHARVVVAGGESVDIARAVDALASFGLTRVVCEGGPTLLADVVAGGRLDELCLTTTPWFVGGSASRIVDGPPNTDSRAWTLRHVIEADGTLFSRWTAQPAPSTSARS